jgi:hypothetical protein
MPTGYTATLHDGEQTFEDYALSVARAFGALITMRDDPSDAKIPDEFESDSYHRNAAHAARRDVARYERMSDADLMAEQETKRDAAVKRHAEYMAACDARRVRYDAMLVHARAYVAPTQDHEGFKKMMVQQLEESIKFDCGDYEPPVPDMESADEYRARKLEGAQREITYHDKKYEEDVQRAKDRSAWVQALRGSLESVHA